MGLHWNDLRVHGHDLPIRVDIEELCMRPRAGLVELPHPRVRPGHAPPSGMGVVHRHREDVPGHRTLNVYWTGGGIE